MRLAPSVEAPFVEACASGSIDCAARARYTAMRRARSRSRGVRAHDTRALPSERFASRRECVASALSSAARCWSSSSRSERAAAAFTKVSRRSFEEHCACVIFAANAAALPELESDIACGVGVVYGGGDECRAACDARRGVAGAAGDHDLRDIAGG